MRSILVLLSVCGYLISGVAAASSHRAAAGSSLSSLSSISSNLVLLDGSRVSAEEAFNVPLVKGVVDAKRRAELLLQLKFAQVGLSADEEMLRENRRSSRQGTSQRHLRDSLSAGSSSSPASRLRFAASAGQKDGSKYTDMSDDVPSSSAAGVSAHAARASGASFQGLGGIAASADAAMAAGRMSLNSGEATALTGGSSDAAAATTSKVVQTAEAGAGAGLVVSIPQTAEALRGLSSISLASSAVDVGNEPLQAQILSQKRLATYYGEVHLGGQPFKVLFDTGSCEFWVPASTCASHTVPQERCAKHSQFTIASSPTFKIFEPEPKMLIQYLSGKIEGPLGTDELTMGALKVPQQAFGVAETIDVLLLDEVRWDGIMGLAYPSSSLARKGVRPVFDNIMDLKLLKEPIFGYYLGPRGGVVTFGAVDRQYIQPGAEFAFASVTVKSYWTVNITGIELDFVGGQKVVTPLCKDIPCKAIVDTGTYLVYGPEEHVRGALRDIQAADCARVPFLPNITYVLYSESAASKTVRVTLTPKDYVLDFRVPVKESNVPFDECSQALYDHPDGQGIDPSRCVRDCVTGIAPDKDTIWTLGQVFLRNYYAVFDRGNNRIGFARAVASGAI